MGVKGLGKLIKGIHSGIYVSLDELLYKNPSLRILAIDTNLYAYKYSVSIGDIAYGIISQCQYLLSRGVLPIYIIDNVKNYASAKKHTQMKRAQRRRTESHHFVTDEIEMLLRHAGIPLIQGPCEADSLCAQLCRAGIVDACLSDDLDLLALGANVLIRKENSEFVIYSREYILGKLDLDVNGLINLIVLLGCDYSPGLRTLGNDPERSLRILKENGCLIQNINISAECKSKRQLFLRAVDTLNQEMQSAVSWIPEAQIAIHEFLEMNPSFALLEVVIMSLINSTKYPRLKNLPFSTARNVIRDREINLISLQSHKCLSSC